MAQKDFRTALQDLRPEHRLRALRMRPSHNRTPTAASNLHHDGWTEPGAPCVTHDVVGDDIHASLAQATSPVSRARTDFDERLVPGETVERVIAWDSERVLAAEMVSDLQPAVLVFFPARDHSVLRRVGTQLGATDPTRNARAIRSGPFLKVWISRHGQDARESDAATTL